MTDRKEERTANIENYASEGCGINISFYKYKLQFGLVE
jgi:hypothetical protein